MNKRTAPRVAPTMNGSKGMQAGAMPKLHLLDESLSPAVLVILLLGITFNFVFQHPLPHRPHILFFTFLPSLCDLLSFYTFFQYFSAFIHSIIPPRAPGILS